MRSGCSASSSRRWPAPGCSRAAPPLKKPADLAQFALIEAGDAHQTHLEWLTWRRWFDEHGLPKLQPKRWLYFNYAYQMVQAALTGQGVVLARLPHGGGSLANGDLVEPLPAPAHGFADGLLADRRPAQRAAPGDQGLLRMAHGPEQGHAARPSAKCRTRTRSTISTEHDGLRRSARPRRCRSGSRPAARRAARARSRPGSPG